MSRAIRACAVLGAVIALGVSGCGGDSGDEQASTVTVTESTADEATPSSPPAPKPKPDPPTRAEQAEAVVKDYYEAVDSASYRDGWKLLSPTLQAELGGYPAWRDGYATTVATKVSGVDATDVNRSSATVAINLEATDLDACGDTVDQTFAGTWTLVAGGSSFLGNAFDVAKTGGGTPVTDPSGCSGTGAPAPAGPVGCDPNYAGGCVPPYPPDVDCIDVGQEVEVVGDDVHNLDLGGDEQACEILPK